MTETESTPLFDGLTAGEPDPSAPVDPAGDTPVDAPTDPVAPPALDLPAGPNLTDLQAFTNAIPDEGHRAIAQHLVDAFTVRDEQLAAFIDAYTTATDAITSLQAALAAETERATAAEQALQDAVTALQPAPADPAAPTTT